MNKKRNFLTITNKIFLNKIVYLVIISGFLLLLTSVSCKKASGSVTIHDIRGTWTFGWSFSGLDDFNNLRHGGSIIFSGEKESGTFTYTQTKPPDINGPFVSSGTYTVDGDNVILTSVIVGNGNFPDSPASGVFIGENLIESPSGVRTIWKCER